ncbi:hypothetical protein A9Q99_00145 [Gammaproteobacteria bacterium 45_16_T64]|nr:hypothetical protein A9Q99_00145 [Gammaproteobacteria bacterium 45_16_T64]
MRCNTFRNHNKKSSPTQLSILTIFIIFLSACGAQNDLDSVGEEISNASQSVGYALKSGFNETLCLDVSEIEIEKSSSDDIANADQDIKVVANPCNNSSGQRWYQDDNNRIRNARETDSCLDYTSLQNYADVVVRICTSSNTQEWSYDNGVLLSSGYAVDLDVNASSVILYTMHGGNNQQWTGLDTTDEIFFEAAETYSNDCAACHGANGEGMGNFPPLTDPGYQEQSLASVIAKTMPIGNTTSCTDDCSTGLAKYIIEQFGDHTEPTLPTIPPTTPPTEPTTPTPPATIPNAVSDILAITDADQNYISVTWSDNSDNEEGFNLLRRRNTSDWISVTTLGEDATEYIDRDVFLGNSYQYQVSAFNQQGESTDVISNLLQLVIQLAPPVSPSSVHAGQNENSISLSWTDNSDNETHFSLHRSTNNGSWIALHNTASTHYTDNDVSYDNSYRYQVRAVNSAGDSAPSSSNSTRVSFIIPAETYYGNNCASCHGNNGQGIEPSPSLLNPDYTVADLSNTITTTMPLGNTTECIGSCADSLAIYIINSFRVIPTAPTAASNVVAVPSGAHDLIGISWNDNSDDESGFSIYRRKNSESWKELSKVSSNIGQYNDLNVANDNSYTYRVEAFNDFGVATSAESNLIELIEVVTIPNAPSQLTGSINNYVVDLSWIDNANNEDRYILQRKENNNAWTNLDQAVVGTDYTDDSVVIGNNYQYRIKAENSAGTSLFSNTVQIELPISLANKKLFDDKCSFCHQPSGTGGDLFDGFRQSPWANRNYQELLTKVSTMPVVSCNETCLDSIATWVWVTQWGYEKKDIDTSSDDRGVRNIRLLTPYEYRNTINDIFGITLSDEKLPHEKFDEHFKFPTEVDKGIALVDDILTYKTLADEVAQNTVLSQIGCGTNACSNDQVSTVGKKIFRRPLTNAEKSAYITFRDQHDSRDMLASMLLSPFFLYRMEIGNWDVSEQAYKLDGYEKASALSYQLWGTTPSAEILALADSGNLENSDQVVSQAEKMMIDRKFSSHFSEFIRYYTKTYGITTEKPGLTNAVINAMKQEQEDAIGYLLQDGTATFNELFNPGYTFVNSALAVHYGITGINGNEMTRVSTDSNRGGLLHQGLTHILNSDFAATSIVKRGKMIRENMMCHTMGVPSGIDPDAITLPNTPMTTRERWDFITGPEASEGQCWQCHQLMNEPGSALESFDQTGTYRTTEYDYNGSATALALDLSGVLRSNSGLDVLASYNSTRELAETMAASTIARNCFVDNYYRFATGHNADPLVNTDKSLAETQFTTSGDILVLIRQLLQSTSFAYRLDRE